MQLNKWTDELFLVGKRRKIEEEVLNPGLIFVCSLKCDCKVHLINRALHGYDVSFDFFTIFEPIVQLKMIISDGIMQ